MNNLVHKLFPLSWTGTLLYVVTVTVVALVSKDAVWTVVSGLFGYLVVVVMNAVGLPVTLERQPQ